MKQNRLVLLFCLLVLAVLSVACSGESATAVPPTAPVKATEAPMATAVLEATGVGITPEETSTEGGEATAVAETAVSGATEIAATALPAATSAVPVAGEPITSHPQLWLTQEDLPRLRSWATESNPLYVDGLLVLAERAREDMDAGHIPAEDSGSIAYEEYPSEFYAQLFAFMSLIGPEGDRADYADRAHTLLMHVINEAAKGPAEGEPFRQPDFAYSDRSRYYGESFALTVDWIYPSLTAEDKATIRTVFLRWIDENMNATYTEYNHPEPMGVVNDPALVSEPAAVRFAMNNYYTAHMRNIGLMAMALDPADDPNGELGGYLSSATGAWLYVVDYAMSHDAAGGLGPEGFEYSPQTISYIVQFLLALHTAGQDNPDRWGQQVVLGNNRYWDDLVTAYFHSLSPQTVTDPDEGQLYLPSWYGDAQRYHLSDWISAFGALGVYDQLVANPVRLNAVRWIQTNTPPGGEQELTARVRSTDNFRESILYFMLFDPNAAPATDPHANLPLSFFAAGLNRLYARTSWGPEAAWFVYSLTWNRVDHQSANGNHITYYRNGEWLTKERTGYANIAEGIISSEYHNTLALENDVPEHDDWRLDLWQRGSQWNYVAAGDPVLWAHTANPHYVYATGNATNLYNSESEGSMDIVQAMREVVWLAPDYIVTYDRATSQTDGRFKRVWWQLPEQAQVDGNMATMTTQSGQSLYITALLPAEAEVTAVNTDDQVIQETAAGSEPMQYRLKIEAPGGPSDTRFLTVLQGADAGTAVAPATLIESTAGTPYQGVVVNGTAVLFSVDYVQFESVTYSVPANTKVQLITNLGALQNYDVTLTPKGDNMEVTITRNTAGTAQSDEAGVLVIGSFE